MKQHKSKKEQEAKKLTEQFRMEYSSVIGSLIYLLNTSPDITFAVTKLAKFMRVLRQEHFRALIHLLQCLRDNSNFGITFYRNVEDSLVYYLLRQAGETNVKTLFGMHDSSWQDCPDTEQSTGSYILFSQGGAVDYSTFVLSPVAMSSAEAKCNSGAVAGMAMSYICMLQNKLKGEEADIIKHDPITIYCDSASAITIVNSDKDIRSLRHWKRRLLFMRQLCREGEQDFKHIHKE